MIVTLLKSWRYPDELKSLYLLSKRRQTGHPVKSIRKLAEELDDFPFCFAVLNRVSRSFAAVIQELPNELRDSVCLFYLILRGLDSIEDDTSASSELRKELLRSFHQKHHISGWSVSGIGDSEDYRQLLENYQSVISAFKNIPDSHQRIILEICEEMGEGMCKYLDKQLVSVEEYDDYCGYVAGLVGVGLSRLFSASGLEAPQIAQNEQLSYSMGLFLQKTNIIRDFHEDLEAGRTFWPKEVWAKYETSLNGFLNNSKEATICLNELVTDALRHAVDCLDYLRAIENQKVFQFCAIPQVMAIATLAEVYNNQYVFARNVKIRKGLAAKLILRTRTFNDAQQIFEDFAIKIFNKIPVNDPNRQLTASYLRRLIQKESKIKEIDLISKQRSMVEKHAMAS